MSYKGQFVAGDVVDFKFTTRRPSTGVPYTLAGTPAVRVYKANSTTQSTAGVSLTVDFDSVTGLNHVRITTASDGTFYANGSQFDVVLEAGTVDGVSVVGECVGRFSLAVTTANVTEWLGTPVILSQDLVPVVAIGWFADPNDSYAGQVLSYSYGDGTPNVNVKRWNFQTVQNISVEVLRGMATRYGDIQGATSTTVTLDNGARAVDGFYVGMVVDFTNSTLFGGQPRVITGYVGATRVATIDSAWANTPTAGTGFYLYQNSTYVGAIPTAAENAAAVLAAGDVDGYSLEETLRLCLSVLAGKLSGAGTGTETFRNTADNKNRVVSTVDDDGNRSAVTLDAS